MVLSTDGGFTFDEIAVGNVPLVGDLARLERLALVKPAADRPIQIEIDGRVKLPEPFGSNAETGLNVTIARPASGGAPTVDVGALTFALDTGFRIGNNTATEFDLGGFATLDLTGFALDLNLGDASKSPTIYTTAAIYINNKTDKRIEFGQASSITRNYGIRASRVENAGDCPDYYIGSACIGFKLAVAGTPANPLFAFDADFFNVSVERVSLASGSNGQPFGVSINGSAGLNIAGVGGKAGFADFTFDKTGITNTGRLAAGAAFFLLQTAEDKGLFTLEVGEYVTARDTTFMVTSGTEAGHY